MRRQETAAAAVADKAERVALLEVRERQRCEREEVAEWRLREEACQRREQEREAAERRAARMRRVPRTMRRFAEAVAVGDGGGGACFGIDKDATPMSRVRQNSVQTTVVC